VSYVLPTSAASAARWSFGSTLHRVSSLTDAPTLIAQRELSNRLLQHLHAEGQEGVDDGLKFVI
jgi:hypothetical protein